MGECAKSDEHLVILVHGIRDIARWQDEIKQTLRADGFTVESTSYGRMNLIEFLLPFSYFRNKAKLTVWTQIQHAKLLHPNASQVSVIAHSFGTYIIAQIVKEQFAFKFYRIIFCGGVVRFDFPIEHYTSRYTSPILNDVGTADPWPAIAEAVTTGYGSVGTYGFHRTGVEDRFHNGAGHGYFLNGEFCKKFWIPFLRCEPGHEKELEKGDVPGKPPHFLIRLLSIFKVKYAILVAALFLGAFYLLRFLFLPDPIGYDFSVGAKFTYWGPGFERLVRSATEACPLPGPLCSYKSIVSAVTERRYVHTRTIEDDVIKNIVSCRNFTFPPPSPEPQRDPVAALEALAGTFPACISTSIDVTGAMEIKANAGGLTRVSRSDGRSDVYLCDCSSAEIQSFRDSQAK
jgi:hypothetical protein